MPPQRPSPMTNTFSVADVNNEVVCPLKNLDGSACRKRCIGEKRYRSMQEHIRRAHPEHYLPKLPATEESFLLMINSPPSERPPPTISSTIPSPALVPPPVGTWSATPQQLTNNLLIGASTVQPMLDSYIYPQSDYISPVQYTRTSDEFRRGSIMPAANAAEALAALHSHRSEPFGFEAEQVGQPFMRRPFDSVSPWGSVCACPDCYFRDMNLQMYSFEMPIRLETFS